MKLMRISIALCGAALLYSASAFANDSNKTTSTITITEKVSIEGKTLAPGEYKVQWERNRSTAQVHCSARKRYGGNISGARDRTTRSESIGCLWNHEAARWLLSTYNYLSGR